MRSKTKTVISLNGLVLPFQIIRQENPRVAARGFSYCANMDTLISFAYCYYSIGKRKIQPSSFVFLLNLLNLCSLRLVNTLPNGKIQTEHAIRHHRKYILQIADLEFKYHNLRHTFGTKLALMNTPEHIWLKQMGHSKSSTTHKYYLAMSEQAVQELKSNLNKL